MKIKFLLSASFIALSFVCVAQNATKTYAITGKPDKQFFWADIKEIDMATGKVIKTLFASNITKHKTTYLDKSPIVNTRTDNPTAYGVAACALDVTHNRLYFAPLHFSDIRYMDLNKPDAAFAVVKNNIITTKQNSIYQSEENHLTRMVIGADGYGYALTNDGNHFIRFTTGKKIVVEDLGSLIDAESNKEISVHNKLTSWGGDMVADAFGSLVMVSANHHVFSIDVNTKIATHLGVITGLPAGYTTNGAAVDAEGNLVVSSANVFDGLYKLSMADMKAVKIEDRESTFNASDLANGNMLSQKEFNASKNVIITPAHTTNAHIFPNPVTTRQFKVLFNNQSEGRYIITLADLSGKAILSKVVNVFSKGQTESIKMENNHARGIYMVTVRDASNNFIFSERILIQ